VAPLFAATAPVIPVPERIPPSVMVTALPLMLPVTMSEPPSRFVGPVKVFVPES
jgi:hypothetical protein